VPAINALKTCLVLAVNVLVGPSKQAIRVASTKRPQTSKNRSGHKERLVLRTSRSRAARVRGQIARLRPPSAGIKQQNAVEAATIVRKLPVKETLVELGRDR